MSELGDKAREEFLSEAQEIIDRLSRDLLLLDATTRVGPADPDLVNSVFRGVHTLKGLCGLFNATRLSTLSHELEDTLDALRLGRLALSAEVLDLLFRAVELYHRLLGAAKAGAGDRSDVELDAFMRELRRVGAPLGDQQAASCAYQLDPSMLAVLTEYEEHRLRTSIEQGLRLYQVRVTFALATIDDGLESLKTTLKRFGEILTYLPTGGGTEADRIELEVLLASAEQLDRVRVGIAELNATVDELPRLSNSPGSPPVATDMPPVPIAQAPQPASSKERAMGLPLRMTMGSEPNISIVGSASPAPAPRADNSLRSVSQTVRVDIQRLDHLMNLLGELAIVRGGIARLLERTRVEPSMREVARDLGRLHHGFERHLATMQTAILEVRMVPLGQVFEKLARVARQTSREVHKDVNLVITGAETEVDKLIGEELSDPLMHMIRNALDHGVEEASQRLAVGKPEAGTIALNAYPKGNQVVVEVEDDGAGIDEKSLLKAAVDAHVVTREEASELSRRERLALIFAPGVTTRSDAGKLSGRGVGMDVVKTNIGRLGGVVDVHSELGIGTKFTITLPITLAMISALMVRVSDNIYAVPLSSVQEAVLVDVRAVRTLQGRQLVTMRGESLPLCFLDVLFGDRRAGVSPGARKLLIVVASAASCRCGFVVDDILGRQDIIIKALSGPLRGAPGFAGATELGDQRVGLVLDIPALLEEALTGIAGPRVLGMVTDA